MYRGSFLSVDVRVLPSQDRFVQVRFPRSKSKRIRRKWARDKARNWRTVQMPMVGPCVLNGVAYVTEKQYAELKWMTSL